MSSYEPIAVMLRNYLKVALRQLGRHKAYSLINIAGLTAGIACFLLILLTVQHELNYDRFHPSADRLYRVVQDVSWGDGEAWDWTPALLGPMLAADFPEVETMARFHRTSALVSYEEGATPLRFQEENVGFVDPVFFDLFAFPFVQGDPAAALAAPNSVVLTESAARKYFGSAPPLGQTLRFDNRMDLKVTGILKDLPTNTHIDLDMAVPFEALRTWYPFDDLTNWWWPTMSTYVRLQEGTDVEGFNRGRLAAFVKQHRESHYAEAIIPRFQPVGDIYLYGNPGGNAIRFVYIFSIIGVFMLLIACVNYMNLATAQASRRAQEVGVRKVVGAQRSQLAGQFLGESLVTTVIALAAAVVLTELALPLYREVSGREIVLDLGSGSLWLILVGIAVLVSFVSGSYPALLLSRFTPVKVLKGGTGPGGLGGRLRQGLVVFQFTITVALIAGTFVVHRQVGYMQTAALGFDTEQVIALHLREEQERYPGFKEALQRQPGIMGVSAVNWYPGVGGGVGYAFTLDGKDIDNDPLVLHTDFDFFRTLNIPIVEGRGFSESFGTDAKEAYILNEAAVRAYEIEHPIGIEAHLFAGEGDNIVMDKRGRVTGIARDFHLTSLRAPISPTAIVISDQPWQLSHVLVRVAPGDVREKLARIEQVWQQHFPQRLFEASFLDEEIDAMYKEEVQFGQAVGTLAALAVLVACLGLFGLAAFMAEQRTKEIGIRKVLGASVSGIVALLSRDFAALVFVAIVLATPLAYYAMQRWLEGFAYRIEISWPIFVGAGLAAISVALLTVSYQAVKAALADPVKSLRYE